MRPLARPALLATALVLAACPTVRRPESKDFTATGVVYVGGVERGGDPLASTRVRAWPEGNLAAGVETTSDDGGLWRLSLPVTAGTRVLLSYQQDGFAPFVRALTVGPYTEVAASAALVPLEELDCSSGPCTVESDEVRIDDPPEGAHGLARAFLPQAELPGLVGLDGLRALAAAWVELDGGAFDPDAGGMPSDAGAAVPSGLRLRIPYVAWSRLEDARPGTGRLEVPLRTLDLAAGRWTQAGEATLFTESGLPIPESALDSLRQGGFRQGAVAQGALTRSGLWAVAYPAASPGCVQGVFEVEGEKSAGVVAQVAGYEASASGEGGAFCASAPLGAGGQAAELSLQYGGLAFSSQQVALPEAAGACGQGACRELGTVKVPAASTLVAAPCRISGRVTDAAFAPLPGAVVVGLDDSVPRNVFASLCGKNASRCTLAVAADEQGRFSLVLPVQTGALLTARALVENPGGLDGVRSGTLRLDGCPAEGFDLALRSGRDAVSVQLAIAGNQLSWTPQRPAAQVRALDADGGVKWDLVSPLGLATPLTYGQVPAGAEQREPASGAPPALVSGDSVDVVLIGTDARGYQYTGGVSEAVP